jgi:hypothetical protein
MVMGKKFSVFRDLDAAEECEVGFIFGEALDLEGEFAGVVVAPH